MAMIKCPGCGQEISDKAKKCVHCGRVLIEDKPVTKICSDCGKENPIDATECTYCGCPFDETVVAETSPVQTAQAKKPKKNLKKIIIPIVAAVVVIAVGLIIYNVKVVRPQKIREINDTTYKEAIELLDNGKYEEAEELLGTIPDYENVNEIKEQIYYETRVYQCIKSLKERLKNPDSLQVYDVVFLSNQYRDGALDSVKEAFKEITDNTDVVAVVMSYGAQNGFGGNTTSYAMFINEGDKYVYFCSSHTLDKDEADDDDDKDACENINIMLDNFEQVGSVNMDRIKTVLKNDAYSTIKIIE